MGDLLATRCNIIYKEVILAFVVEEQKLAIHKDDWGEVSTPKTRNLLLLPIDAKNNLPSQDDESPSKPLFALSKQ